MGALATLQDGNKCSEETKAKADVFLHQHIDEMLKFEYSNSEKNNDLLMKNHQARPTGSLALPEANAVNNNNNKNSGSKKGRGNSRGRGRGRGHYGHNHQQNNEVGTSQNPKGSCFRCGSVNHWSKACRTPSHLCELYQASRKGKEKEVNHVGQFDNTNTKLIASDFFNDLEL
ncbi:hypothetical protein Tco_1395880 [Tanacetum coccineum]